MVASADESVRKSTSRRKLKLRHKNELLLQHKSKRKFLSNKRHFLYGEALKKKKKKKKKEPICTVTSACIDFNTSICTRFYQSITLSRTRRLWCIITKQNSVTQITKQHHHILHLLLHQTNQQTSWGNQI